MCCLASTVVPECQRFEVRCDDGQCVTGAQCDAVLDCDDGSDESAARCGIANKCL